MGAVALGREARRLGRQPRDPELAELHARLVNWARCYRDRLWRARAPAGLSPDELDAAEMERVLVRLRRLRPGLWRVVREVYLRRRDDVTGAQVLRISVRTYQERLTRAYHWLHGYLARS